MASDRLPYLPAFQELDGEQYAVVQALLVMIQAKHPPTYRHLENVALYAGLLAERLGLRDAEVRRVQLAGLLHDLGMVAVPDAILCKPGPLARGEISVLMQHAAVGAGLVTSFPELTDLALAVRHHHEWFNGRGYPDGLQGEQIPLAARIVAVADAFDAMTTPHPYRRPLGVARALQELERCAGTQFDPRLTAVFVQLARTAYEQGACWLKHASRQAGDNAGTRFLPLPERLAAATDGPRPGKG